MTKSTANTTLTWKSYLLCSEWPECLELVVEIQHVVARICCDTSLIHSLSHSLHLSISRRNSVTYLLLFLSLSLSISILSHSLICIWALKKTQDKLENACLKWFAEVSETLVNKSFYVDALHCKISQSAGNFLNTFKCKYRENEN